MIRHLWIFALLIAGCGGGMQAIEQLPPPPQVLPDISGTYVITFAGFVDVGLPTPAINATIKQEPFSGDTAKLDIGGNANTGFCAPDGQQWATTGSIDKAEKLAITITLGDGSKTVLTMASDDFRTLAGTWMPGPAISSCGGFTTSGPGFTWKAVKQ